MKNIYIFGYTGMLGNYIYKYLSEFLDRYQVKGYNTNNFDILNSNYEQFENFIKKNINENQSNIIINASGIIPQSLDKNNEQYYKYYKINSIFPNWLTILSNKYNFKVIHATTDCVFSGKKGNYIESDIHDEINDYGKSKSLGENNEITIIRTSIIGDEIKTKKSLLEWVKSKKNGEISGYNNHYWNGITCYQFAKIIMEIIDKNLYWKGVRHIYSPETVSKYELLLYINDIYELNIKINKYKCDNMIDKSLNTIYEINKTFNIPSLKIQILEQKKFDIFNDGI